MEMETRNNEHRRNAKLWLLAALIYGASVCCSPFVVWRMMPMNYDDTLDAAITAMREGKSEGAAAEVARSKVCEAIRQLKELSHRDDRVGLVARNALHSIREVAR